MMKIQVMVFFIMIPFTLKMEAAWFSEALLFCHITTQLSSAQSS
jgi:hypothetical protein